MYVRLARQVLIIMAVLRAI